MRLRRLLEVSASEWVALAQLTPIALATKIALHRVPLRNVIGQLEWFGRHSRFGLPLHARSLDEHRLYTLADWATRIPGGATPCLVRSLVLHLLLRRRGEPSTIALGVRKCGAELRAHAWVTLRGQPLGESEATLAEFTPIAHLGSA